MKDIGHCKSELLRFAIKYFTKNGKMGLSLHNKEYEEFKKSLPQKKWHSIKNVLKCKEFKKIHSENYRYLYNAMIKNGYNGPPLIFRKPAVKKTEEIIYPLYLSEQFISQNKSLYERLHKK